MALANAHESMAKYDFRVAQPDDFRKLRMCVFFDELRFLSEERSLKGLLIELSMATRGDSQMEAWQARLRGEYLPGRDQIDLVRRRYPGMRFDLHHPAWDLLAHPSMSRRNLRRLLAKLPEQWHRIRALLGVLPTAELCVRPSLPDKLHLHSLDFLDTLLLLWCEREESIAKKLKDRHAALDRILWLLPVLYPLDPMWTRAELYQERHRRMLNATDFALGLTGEESPGKHWGWCTRESMIFDQQWHVQERMRRVPQGLRTSKDRMRYLARVWYWRPHTKPSEEPVT